MALTLQGVLVRALKKLGEWSFQCLTWIVKAFYKDNKKYRLTDKDPKDAADKITEFHEHSHGAEVTPAALEEISQKKAQEELRHDLRKVDIAGHGLGTAEFTEKVKFIGRHRSDIILRITDVNSVLHDLLDQDLLTQEQYNDVMKKTKSWAKMSELCYIIRRWDDIEKYIAYESVRKHNEDLINDLLAKDKTGIGLWLDEDEYNDHNRKYENFTDFTESDLIRRINNVNSVLHDLRDQDLLTEEQYTDVMKQRTSWEKMRKLCGIIRRWEDKEKYMAYIVLRKHNSKVIEDLLKPYVLRIAGDNEEVNVNFIDHHQLDLIRTVTDVDPVVRDLKDQNLLTEDQYSNVMKKETTQEKMRDLCVIIRDWEDTETHMAFNVLKRYNEKHIKDLLEKDKMIKIPQPLYFNAVRLIDTYEQDLIKLINNVHPVIDDLYYKNLLTREERDYFMQIPDSEDMMRHLYDIMRKWKDFEKQKVYHILHKHNIKVIENVIKEDFPKSEQYSGFLERHHLDLISRVIMVDPILDDLRDQGFLKEKQYDLLYRQPSVRKKITELLDTINTWGYYLKMKFFKSLLAHNPSIVKDLQRGDRKEKAGVDSYLKDMKIPQYRNMSAPLDYEDDRFTRPDKDMKIPQYRNMSAPLDYGDDRFTRPDKDIQILQYRHTSAPLYYEDERSIRLEIKPDKARKHFVDDHCWDLIRRIIMVDPVLDDLLERNLLPQEQYDAISSLETPQKKMIDLYDIVRFWTNFNKDQVYLALRQHNPAFIRVLEKSDQMLKWGNSKKGSQFHKLTLDLETGFSAGKHFLDKHRSGLINVISTVNPVVEELREEDLLSEEQYHNILLKETSKEKMAALYEISESFNNKNKDKVYLSIRKHNQQHIRVVERISRPSLPAPPPSDGTEEYVEPEYYREDKQNTWVTPGPMRLTITCSICLEMYKDPVTLTCGHNYCLGCIENTWNNQQKDDTSCPICRRRYKNRPELNRNLVLCQIAEYCQSTKSPVKTNERCTSCTSIICKFAVKQCLLCEAFLCEDHLQVHSKEAEHVILDLSKLSKERRCPIHKRLLEYYCSQDSTCVCPHCCIVGEHKGHIVITFREAMEIKKDELRVMEEKLKLKKSETEKYLKICKQRVQEKEPNVPEPGTDGAEAQGMEEILKLVQGGLSVEEGWAALSVEDLIRQLEEKRSHLTQFIAHIEGLCNETDPLLVLRDQEDYDL